jgi:uncharacterized phage-associated protein
MKSATSETKLKELVLFIAQRCESHQLFGKVKLNKILFFSDVNAYVRHGQPITGVDYVKREFGPVPDQMAQRLEEMVQDKWATVVERDMPDMTSQKRVVPLQRKPDLSSFSADDISIVSEMIDWMRPMTANEISDLSHKSVGWDVARMGEKIPLATALIPEVQPPLTPKELQTGARLAQQVARQHGS